MSRAPTRASASRARQRTHGTPASRSADGARPAASAIGNRAVQQMLIQTKLRVGTSTDRYECEAERVAGEVVGTLGNASPPAAAPAISERSSVPRIQRK